MTYYHVQCKNCGAAHDTQFCHWLPAQSSSPVLFFDEVTNKWVERQNSNSSENFAKQK